MEELTTQIRSCTQCLPFLPHGVHPVFQAHPKARLAIIGQAPGRIVHETGVPFDDKSGDRLRHWMGIRKDDFYNPQKLAIIPMGFCYPGKGKSGDLPPRPECAPLWHQPLLEYMPHLQLILLIGQYAQHYYLKDRAQRTLTETVQHFRDYWPPYLVLPHPSPRNNIWLKKNPWFEMEVLPVLKELVSGMM